MVLCPRGTREAGRSKVLKGLVPKVGVDPRNFRKRLIQLGFSYMTLILNEFLAGSILSSVFVSLICCHL